MIICKFGLFRSANSKSISLENLDGGWVRWEEVEIQGWEDDGEGGWVRWEEVEIQGWEDDGILPKGQCFGDFQTGFIDLTNTLLQAPRLQNSQLSIKFKLHINIKIVKSKVFPKATYITCS